MYSRSVSFSFALRAGYFVAVGVGVALRDETVSLRAGAGVVLRGGVVALRAGAGVALCFRGGTVSLRAGAGIVLRDGGLHFPAVGLIKRFKFILT